MGDRMGGGDEAVRERECTYLYVIGPCKSKKSRMLLF